MKTEIYMTPCIESIDIAVEQGFAGSGSTEGTGEGANYGDDDFTS